MITPDDIQSASSGAPQPWDSEKLPYQHDKKRSRDDAFSRDVTPADRLTALRAAGERAIIPPEQRRVSGNVRGNRQCTFIKADGQRCQSAPVVGGAICVYHGGNAPAAKAAATMRLLQLVEPAVETLFAALGRDCKYEKQPEGFVMCTAHGLDCPKWSDKVNAAKALLDRSGFGPRATLAIENPKDDLSKIPTHALADELEALARLARERANLSAPILDVTPTAEETGDDPADHG